jgi:RNA polymerase sigma-70 factor (ECF subfamily)
MGLDDAAIERLVDGARSGEVSAFGLLFDHFHLPVYRYVACRVRRPSDAEDLTQSIFVKALEALPRYESRGIPFGGWLFRLARNAVIDFVRTSHEHADLAESADRAGPDIAPDDLAVRRQEIEAVGVALLALTDEQRDAIALRFFAGLSAREAAEAADAALVAYSTTLTEAASEVDGYPEAMATLEVALAREVIILAVLVETVPPPAVVAATQALETCNMTLDELSDR